MKPSALVLKAPLAGIVPTGLVLAGLVAAFAAPVMAAGIRGDAAAGKEIALRWCAACHVVAEGQERANASLPTFMDVARATQDDTSALEGFLADPHPAMPDMSLTRQEIRDLVAYIGSLR